MKYVSILLFLLLTSFRNPANFFIGGVLPIVTVKCNCTEEVVQTTYKVNELYYNPTNKVLRNRVIENSNNVPDIVALSGKYKKMYHVGDTIKFIIDNKIVKKEYYDVMNTRYSNRVDFLINRKDTHKKRVIKILL